MEAMDEVARDLLETAKSLAVALRMKNLSQRNKARILEAAYQVMARAEAAGVQSADEDDQ
jgi:hypothetical protein